MKYIIILLLSFIILLGGCNPYPKDDVLESYGYDPKDNGNYILEISDVANVYTYSDPNTEEPIGIGASVYANSYQGVSLRYNDVVEAWEGHTEVEPEIYSSATDASANDVYAYMLTIEPKIGSELAKIAEYKKIPMEQLEGGNSDKIIEKLNTNIKITNPKFSKSSNTMEKAPRNEYVLLVNFDITNNTKEDIDFSKLDAMLCYSVSNGSGQCNFLPTLYQSDLKLLNEKLKSGSKANIHYKTIVPDNAKDFYISVNDPTQEAIHATSE